MKKEIGGYIEFQDLEHGYNRYPSFIALNSGRNAFLYYVLLKNIKKVYLPFFLCDSVYIVCKNNNIEFERYHINENMYPIFDKKIEENELMYIVNYYGQFDETEIKAFKQKFRNILIDNVQCFYSRPIDEIPTIYSCRKFFGVPDGGYLYFKNPCKSHLNLQKDDSDNRMTHLYGRRDKTASDYYQSFLENESLISKLPLMLMSDTTNKLMSNVDHDYIIEQRNKNFEYLSKRLSDLNGLVPKINPGPYCYPFYFPNSDNLRKELTKKKVYVPLLWPNVVREGSHIEVGYAKDILPLPCDQRYSIEEMSFVCDIIENYVKK